ncbi:hypothetical protein ACP4OV_019953 [Aristida adscensionis]
MAVCSVTPVYRWAIASPRIRIGVTAVPEIGSARCRGDGGGLASAQRVRSG